GSLTRGTRRAALQPAPVDKASLRRQGTAGRPHGGTEPALGSLRKRTEGPIERHPADVCRLRALHPSRHLGQVPGAEPAAGADRLGALLRPPAAGLHLVPAAVWARAAAHAAAGAAAAALWLPARRDLLQLHRPAAPAADDDGSNPLRLAAADRRAVGAAARRAGRAAALDRYPDRLRRR